MIDSKWSKLAFKKNLVTPGEALPNLAGQPVLAVDVETMPRPEFRETDGAGLSPWRANLLGICVAVPGESWYLPLRHRAAGSEAYNLNPDQVLPWLRDAIRATKVLVNHNLKFDLEHLSVNGGLTAADYRGARLVDTMLAAQLIDEREPSHGLKPLTEKYIGLPADEEKAKDAYLVGQTKKRQDWSVVPVDVLAPYGCSDVERTLRLAAWQVDRLAAEQLDEVYRMEGEVLRVLVDGELLGTAVDLELLKKERRDMLAEAIQLEDELERLLGVTINPSSADELADVLTTKLGLPILARTKPTDRYPYGQPAFDDEALLRYIREYPEHARIFWNVRKARRLHHVRTSFVEAYLKWHVDGAIHPNFNQLGTVTGRMSCDSPNLQQVPGTEKFTLEAGDQEEKWTAPGARQYFVPRPGCSLVFYDYSQVEYRLFAHYSNSPRLIQAYVDDPKTDMHQWATDLINGILGTNLSRKSIKNGNFGILYGMQKEKTIKYMQENDADVTEAQALQVLDVYYREVPELAGLRDRVGQALLQRGYVKTILGRRRRIARNLGWQPKGRGKREDRGLKPYQALNMICQGSSADLLKYQAVRGHEVAKQFGGNLLLTIHDELVFEVPTGEALDMARALRPVLETFTDDNGKPRLRVPIYVDGELAVTRWSEAEGLDLVAKALE